MNTEKAQRVVVISGGMGYVGMEVARAFAKKNMPIAILYHSTSPEKVASFVRELGDNTRAYACDLNSEEAIKNVFNKISAEQGVPYICVDTSGKKPLRKKILSTTLGEVRDQLETTFISSWNFLTESARVCSTHRAGYVIGVTTAGVLVPKATQTLGGYIPAKYAVQGLLTTLREEIASSGVKVYSIAPGFMSEGMNADIPRAFVDIIRAKSTSKKILDAATVAKKIVEVCESSDPMSAGGDILLAPEYAV